MFFLKKKKKFKFLNLYIKKQKILKGIICLKSLDFGLLKLKQFKSIFLILNKFLKKKGKFFFFLHPHMPLTKKNKNFRMGKGKGKINLNVIPVKPGQKIFEIYLMEIKYLYILLIYLKEIKIKLPIKTKIIFNFFKC